MFVLFRFKEYASESWVQVSVRTCSSGGEHEFSMDGKTYEILTLIVVLPLKIVL